MLGLGNDLRVTISDVVNVSIEKFIGIWPHSITTIRNGIMAVRTYNRQEAERRRRRECSGSPTFCPGLG
ncbi:hypothetical protein GCM10007884_22430 [Methylobacterium brachythecii]|uniref:Uncharacterized protein n=1 Tax=Methylobacterium brachythecii TaxID=1176177 RepID=A0ABQ6D2H2_9HYPH|nr:hypothetical protein GCM10007884_22430 [Methylobacterium brachythecii]